MVNFNNFLRDAREFLRTKGGAWAVGVAVIVALGALYLSFRSSFGETDLQAASRSRWYVCTETGKAFEREIDLQTVPPVRSPYSGKDTGAEAELCFWTKDGSVKDDPTPVLLNEATGKPGPTFCPECDRLVVGLNPFPTPGASPPPTRQEYRPPERRGKRRAARDGPASSDEPR